MANLFGLLTTSDSDRAYANQVGQRVVYDAIQTYINKVNMDLDMAISVFVEGNTEDFAERYKLPGGGRLQRRGLQGRPAPVKVSGGWDVAYPIEDFAEQIAGDDVSMAYMTVGDIERHLSTLTVQDTNTVRHEMLRRLFRNTADTFIDPLPLSTTPTLTIQPLANGDTVVYPPALGSESEATDDHYLESNYAASAISDTNNPYATIRDEIEEHFGASTGGENIVVFINNAQTAKTQALSDFDEVPDRFIRVGDNVDVPINLPMVPGRILGRVSGCWVSEWRWIPANYLLGLHLEVPAPLKRRVDVAGTGLPQGLALIAEDMEFPLEHSYWRHRFGFGVGNRLNGVVMELGTGGSYTIPTAYQ